MQIATQLDLKTVKDAQRHTAQSRTREDPTSQFGSGLLYWLAGAGEYIAPWWSPRRDLDLESFWKDSDHLSSAIFTLQARLTSIPVWIEPRDITLKKYIKQADDFTRKLIEDSAFGKGWVTTFGQFAQNIWTADGGGYLEIIGPGRKDGPLTGKPITIAPLDTHRCSRTNNPEWPVIYQDTDSKYYKLHRTRVAFASQMPSTIAEMNGIGFSAVGRCIHSAQNLIDMSRYKEEKLGSRPMRAIMWAPGINVATIQNALELSRLQMDSKNLSRMSQIPVIGDIPTDATLNLLDLASLPDGFNEEQATQLGMFTIAMAFGVPIRWLWPAAVIGATKADAMYQHIAGLGSFAQVLTTMKYMLGGSDRGSYHMEGKFLPPHLKLVFDFQDDEQDARRAEIQKRGAGAGPLNLDTFITNIRVEREKALADGDISRSQFVQLELSDGRLEDGTDAIALFLTDEPRLREFLDLGIPNPTNTNAYAPEVIIDLIDEKIPLAQAEVLRTGNGKDTARLALAAVNRLRALYVEKLEAKHRPPRIRDEEPETNGEVESPNESPNNDSHTPIASESVAASKYVTEEGHIVPRPGSGFARTESDEIDERDVIEAIEDWQDRAPSALSRLLEAIPTER